MTSVSKLEEVVNKISVLIVRVPPTDSMHTGKTTVQYTVVQWDPLRAESLLLEAGTNQFFIRDDHPVLFGSHRALACYILDRYEKNPEWTKKSLDLSLHRISKRTGGDVCDCWVDIPEHDFMLLTRDVDFSDGHDCVCQLLADWHQLKAGKLDLTPFESTVLEFTGDTFWFDNDTTSEEEDEDETDETELDKE